MPQADQSPLVVGHARVLPAQIGHGLTVTLGARPEDRQIRVRDPLSGRIARPWPVVLGHPDQPRHLIRHGRQEPAPVVLAEPAGRHLRRQQDLDVHLMVGGGHTRGIVERIGIDADALPRRLDAPGLRHAEIGALADDTRAHLIAIDADRVIGAVARIGL